MLWIILGGILGLILLGGLAERLEAGKGLAELGLGIKTMISEALSPQIRPSFYFTYGWGWSKDGTKGSQNGTDDATHDENSPWWWPF